MAYRLAMATVSATAESGRPRTGARGRRLLVPALFALRRMQAHAQRTVVVAIGIAVGAAVLALTAVGSGAVQDRAVQRGLAPEFDARALVGLRLGLLGAPAAECERVADRLLERVGLLDKCRALPAELSGGQQQRVAICAALAHRPRLFIADEPTGELDARALVGLRLGLLGAPAAECERVADRLLERVGLLDKCRALPAELSGGQQQRVAICAALAHRPRLFIADEPTGNLDPVISWEIIQLLLRINELGVTVLMATHNADVVTAVRRRVVALENGRIVRDELGAAYHRED